MKKFLCAFCFLFFILNCWGETPSMELTLIQGKKETVFYQGKLIPSIQKKIENAKPTDNYIKSVVDNIVFKIIISDKDNVKTEYKVYNQYALIKDAKHVYECDVFLDLCILFINSTNNLSKPQSMSDSDGTDDFLFSFVKDDAAEYGGMDSLLKKSFGKRSFIISISDSLADSVGIREQGFNLKKIIEDEDYCLVVYEKETVSCFKLNETEMVYNCDDESMFLILINKKEYKLALESIPITKDIFTDILLIRNNI